MKHPIPITLSESERASLQTFIHAGKANARRCTISWRFTSNDARDKLHDLYPVVNNHLD